MPSKLFVIACEPSGDTHGAALLHELKRLHPDLIIEGLGGPKMEKEGAQLIYDMTTISALGLGDVLRLYFRYLKIFNQALARVETFRPDAIVAIDSPAFNLRFAKKIKKRFPFIYYISPQLWAWGQRRIHVVKKFITKMLVILPFEKTMYDKAGVDCAFVGHPLLDHLETPESKSNLQKKWGLQNSGPVIGLLPGSRKKEVERIFPLMLESAREIKKLIPSAVFVTVTSPNVPQKTFADIFAAFPDVSVTSSAFSMQTTVAGLDFGLVTSGTATLETAMIGTPFFLLYKASASTYFLGKHLVKVPFLGLVNLLAGKRVVPEFIQGDIRPEIIAKEVKNYLEDKSLYEGMKEDFLAVKKMLGDSGASQRTAEEISRFLTRS